MKLPFLQFYPADYMRDTRALSLAAKGGWVDMICMLHSAPTRGTLKLPIVSWARIIGAEVDQAERVIDELEMLGVADITKESDGVTVVCRRMEGEFEDRSKNAERQKRFRENGGGDPERWTAIRVEILKRDDYTCAYCGRKARTVDHVKPRCQGGDEAHTNLVAACNKCNNKKTGRTPEEAGMSFWNGFNRLVLEDSNVKSNGERNGERNGEQTPNKTETISQKSEVRKEEGADAPVLPEALATDSFRAKWAEYEAYRRESGMRKLKPASVAKQWAEMAEWGHDGAIGAIEMTIKQGWQGVFPPKPEINGRAAAHGQSAFTGVFGA